jgi:hypothetical protein
MAWPTVEAHPTPDIRELLVNSSTIDPSTAAYGMKLPKAVATALDATVVIGPASETLHMNRHPPQSLARIDSSADRG